MKRRPAFYALLVILILGVLPLVAYAQAGAATEPTLPLDLAKGAAAAGGSLPVQIVVLLTLLSFIPAILVSMTCFTRLIVVFHFLRQALGTQETPNNQVLIGLALFITMFVMAPVAKRVNQEALQPMIAEEITQTEAITRALVPISAYMLKHTRERDLALFLRLSGA